MTMKINIGDVEITSKSSSKSKGHLTFNILLLKMRFIFLFLSIVSAITIVGNVKLKHSKLSSITTFLLIIYFLFSVNAKALEKAETTTHGWSPGL